MVSLLRNQRWPRSGLRDDVSLATAQHDPTTLTHTRPPLGFRTLHKNVPGLDWTGLDRTSHTPLLLMPKKRNHNFKQLQGCSSSSRQTAPASHGEDGNKPSVNERLSELRKLEGKDAAARKRLMAESVNQRSVPPEVRGILGVPESAPPKPKAGVRARDRLRTPGPAPPKSWLASSAAWTPTLAMRGGRKIGSRSANAPDRHRPKELLRFARLTGLDERAAHEKPSSMMHLSLKAIAESFSLFEEEDYPALVEVPLRLRLKLLPYISCYGLPITSRQLRALLQGDDSIRNLDLGGLIGHASLTVKKLGRMIEDEQEKSSLDVQDEILDSWDTETLPEKNLQPCPSLARFSSLTHLCLSHPGPGASWRDLLGFMKLVPQVTHLSLAYWPRPTLTPNLATTTVSSRHGPDVTAGGSHYYSTLDQDMTEPATLLKQLSARLLCLQWLDLEGCHDWFPALNKLAMDVGPHPEQQSTDPFAGDAWSAVAPGPPSVLTTNWKNLAYVRCSQGWLPDMAGVQAARPDMAGCMIRSIVLDLVDKLRETPVSSPAPDTLEVGKKRAGLWLETEFKIMRTCSAINFLRRQKGCTTIEMDCGWIKR
ncbi:uncharacterized protein LTR77_005122 [Saxophila tyrrhenica]|uniref:Uncharacterized protein n=1 Tax=Saxophila tyrrhenica TaxID=1690608 RepID=A0AAV9PAZ3_9PEZI|nr:hypothetical protein LTR77_005122 [Saxophila tyrrhenica]